MSLGLIKPTEKESIAWTRETILYARECVKEFKNKMEILLVNPMAYDCWSMCSLRDLVNNMDDFICDTDDVEDGESDLDV